MAVERRCQVGLGAWEQVLIIGLPSRNPCCRNRSDQLSAVVDAAGHGVFCRTHRKLLNELLGAHVAKLTSVSTFRLLLAELDEERIEGLQLQWRAAQLGITYADYDRY